MSKIIKAIVYALTILLTYTPISSFACSMCKVTLNGSTYLGSNEDSWRRTSRIWFENGKAGRLGCLYVGFSDLPQGGMNEAGLAFDGLTTPPKPVINTPTKKEIIDPTTFLKHIMQTCKTVEDVARFAIQYNRQKFYNNGVLLFADKYGNYLIMESDTLITGNDDKYLIANFCPSITSEHEKRSFARYKRGETFLMNHVKDTNSSLCFALIDTMHECRQRIGDGTMYSFVADLNKGDFTLWFYHDFKHPVTFNLSQELAKGDHILQMPAIFPTNAEYQKFLSYKTPRNNVAMLSFLYSGGGLFAFSFLFFTISFFQKRKLAVDRKSDKNIRLILVLISLVLLFYVSVLIRNEEIFYFPAPYKYYRFSILNMAAYIPFFLLALIVPLIRMNLKVFKCTSWGYFSKGLFVLNNIIYFILIVLFFYWGLYNIL